MVNDGEHLLMYLLAIYNVFFGKISIQIFRLFFNWIYIYIFAFELYEFIIYFGCYVLSDIWIADIFLRSVGCLLIWLMVSSGVKKLF